MKFEWFELLRELEMHTENTAEFEKALHALTKQDVMRLWITMKQDEIRPAS